MEDKEKIIEKLRDALLETRELHDLEDLYYVPENSNGDEFVVALFRLGGTKIINVTMDSGIAMIRDVLRGLS